MKNEKSRFLKNADETIYDSQTSLTWMANDSRIDLKKDVSWDETEGYIKEMNGKSFG
ncbi:MAG: hypothetical protein HOD16_01865, partial [Nitrospina sp.]|nr:hypothetical protein [Nitrospina sp.]